MEELTPELLLAAYGNGIFPMADPDSDGEISWYSPAQRGVLPLESFHVPHDLSRLIRQRQFEVTFDRDFEAVMRGCADRESTWISEQLVAAYVELHGTGHAHSVECRQEGRLVGGLYGVSLGGVFFGESMFHRVRDASKVALVHLAERLKRGGYVLLDTQFVSPHLEQFGATEIDREEYLRRLADALDMDATW
ncbi:MAG: leucyl/phenylalanyl-tRNA--protein transferase [Planctomycetes bacterium]|nr:leucyl/phenylalanyl-tRNA--protein transferase [Planctomycetota bacterium]